MTNNSVKFFLITILFSVLITQILKADDEDILRIGIIVDGPWKKNVQYISLIKSEINR